MTIKTLVSAALLVAAPTFAFAQCSSGHHDEKVVMSCADGTVYDAEKNECVVMTS